MSNLCLMGDIALHPSNPFTTGNRETETVIVEDDEFSLPHGTGPSSRASGGVSARPSNAPSAKTRAPGLALAGVTTAASTTAPAPSVHMRMNLEGERVVIQRKDGRLGFAVAFTQGRHQVDMIGQNPNIVFGTMTDGDEILAINGQSTQGLSHSLVVDMLRASGAETILHIERCASALARLVSGGTRGIKAMPTVTMLLVTTTSLAGPREKLVLNGVDMDIANLAAAVRARLGKSVEKEKVKSSSLYHYTLRQGAISGTIFAQAMARAATELERLGWRLYASLPSGREGDTACFKCVPENVFAGAWCSLHIDDQRITILDAPRHLVVRLLETASAHIGPHSTLVHRYDPKQEVDQLTLGDNQALRMLPALAATLDSLGWGVQPIAFRKGGPICFYCRPPDAAVGRRPEDWVEC